MELLIVVGPILGGILLYYVIAVVVKEHEASLSQKFVKIGNLQGKTLQEITH